MSWTRSIRVRRFLAGALTWPLFVAVTRHLEYDWTLNAQPRQRPR